MHRYLAVICRANGARQTLPCLTLRLAHEIARRAMRNGAQWAEIETSAGACLAIFE
jgi:hypothetical protein